MYVYVHFIISPTVSALNISFSVGWETQLKISKEVWKVSVMCSCALLPVGCGLNLVKDRQSLSGTLVT